MSHQMNTNFDNDLDAYLNYDQNDQTPMSSSDVKPVPNLLPQTSDFSSNPQTYSGPSYQYDSHRQQTGLPMGAYANTLAVNNANGLHFRGGNNGFVMPTETLNVPLSNLDDFDFNHSHFDLDMENESSTDIPSMFYPASQSSISPATQIPARIYPGMHTQQANEAKMQQVQKQQEIMRQQKQMPAGQQPLPASSSKSPAAKDPHVEESISRLLNRMRQNSAGSAGDDDDDETSPTDGMSGLPRMKKDEDDMDEDERLLNSEEGKKLSSKERRQLRNKVSARAFRSRRKEYITQLESEVAAKAQEANELRVQNRQLMEENTRLTDLTRMLLSSQAFSGFLQELSQSGAPNNLLPQQQQQRQQQRQPQQSQPQPQPQPNRKDVPTHEAARQIQSHNNHMQVGMTLIPDTPLDMSIFDGPGSWNSVIPSNDFQVFAVAEMPEPPKLDMEAISGKSSENKSMPSSKKDLPIIPSLPTTVSTPKDLPMINTQSDDLYDYESSAAATTLELPTALTITLAKASVSSEILAAQSTQQSWFIPGSSSSLQQMCDELDETLEKLSQLLS